MLFIDGPSDAEHRQWLETCCRTESRCRWLPQDPGEIGIFGAMNQGFAEAAPHEWVLFWGSDDWAAGPEVLARVSEAIEEGQLKGEASDLLVCRGRYVDASSGALTRHALFISNRFLNTHDFRRVMWLGFTPPHQAAIFGPGARRRLSRYASGFRLSADLDYFLQLSKCPGLFIECLDLELVHMSDGGISGQQTKRRLQEVSRAYRRSFIWSWWFPFALRYIRRISSLFKRG